MLIFFLSFLFSNIIFIQKIKISMSSGTEEIIREQTTSNSQTQIQAHHPSSTAYQSALGQSFRSTTGNFNLSKAAFEMEKTIAGSPTANLTANLYLSVSDKPSGSVLATSNPINSSSLSTSFVWYNFTFPSGYTLLNNTWYCIEVQAGSEGLIDNGHFVYLREQTSNVVEGCWSGYWSSSWHSISGWDMAFIVYGFWVPTPAFVSFYHNSDGSFLVNGTLKMNGSSTEYYVGEVLNLAAFPSSRDYHFSNFTWDTGSSTSNPHLLTVKSNLTIWAYFFYLPWNITSTIQMTNAGSPFQQTAIDYPIQRRSFYALGHFWVFYSDGANAHWASSPDSQIWQTHIIGGVGELGYRVTTVYDGNGSVHFAQAQEGGVEYRKFSAYSNGTLKQISSQIVIPPTSNASGYRPSIALDSSGRIYISYQKYNATIVKNSLWVTRSSVNNGSWITDSGYPAEIMGDSNSQYYSALVALPSNQMYLVIGRDINVYGSSYNGTGWEPYTSITQTQDSTRISAVALNDTVYLAYNGYSPFDYINIRKRNFVSGTWTLVKTISGFFSYVNCPCLSVSNNLSKFYVFWAYQNSVYYVRYEDGEWTNPKLMFTEPLSIYSQKLNLFYDANAFVGITYLAKTIAPYAIKFAAYYASELYATSYMNANGTLEVNGNSKTNGTQTKMDYYETMTIQAYPASHYHFHNFTWNTGFSTSNPYDLQTATSNFTIWCYFKPDPYVTFYKYKTSLTFSVNASSKANGTEVQYALGTFLNLQGSGWAKYYGFGNWTFSYDGASEANPYSHIVTEDANYSIMLYDKWSPSEWTPDFPSTPSALQYLINGNYLGFIHSIFVSTLGETFYALILLFLSLAVYIRNKTIAIPSILWILFGGFWAVLSPAFAPVPYIISGIGVAGILYSIFVKGSE
jgi:hypothetical protein